MNEAFRSLQNKRYGRALLSRVAERRMHHSFVLAHCIVAPKRSLTFIDFRPQALRSHPAKLPQLTVFGLVYPLNGGMCHPNFSQLLL